MIKIKCFFPCFLMLCETFHVLIHIFVLFRLYTIESWGLHIRLLYFYLDLWSSFCTLLYTRRNASLVLIHFLIHLFALLFLIYGGPFSYSAVFQMAEGIFEEGNFDTFIYYLGTVEDIVTHLFNIYFLIRSFVNEKSVGLPRCVYSYPRMLKLWVRKEKLVS